MGNYSKEEIQNFKDKDLRITKLAILKELINKLDTEDVTEPERMLFELTNQYVNYTYKSMKRVKEVQEKTISWVHLAEGLGLPEPSQPNIKILDAVMVEYKQANRANLNPSNLLQYLIKAFGGYPTKQAGIATILKQYKE